MGIGFGLKSSTHSGAELLGLGINSLISTTGELDSAIAGCTINTIPHTTSRSETTRREHIDIGAFLTA